MFFELSSFSERFVPRKSGTVWCACGPPSLHHSSPSLQESNRSLSAQKDALLAERTALRKEVARWNARTNQLIEQYNKVDPEEYKRLL